MKRNQVAIVSHGTTLVFVLIGWAILFVALPVWPATWWYELEGTDITDRLTPEGGRVMEIERTIHRDFVGDYRVEEQLRLGPRSYYTAQVCKGSGIRYRKDASLPALPTLEWWKGEQCVIRWPYDRLPPGIYRVCTWVTIHPTYFPKKEVSICSNDFSRSLP